MTPTSELRTIAQTIDENGGWHIAALKVLDAADELDRHRAEEPPTLQTERDCYCLLLSALVRRMEECHADERYKAVWHSYMIHGGKYTEPTYTAEFERARDFLRGAGSAEVK